jgi:hypothetical protein
VLGEIEGDGSGGVQFTGSVVSTSSDFAEYLPSLEPDDQFEPGEVVGLFGGHVSHRTRGADRAMVVSTHPVVGGRPHPEDASRHARVAFLGQVPVRVRGPVSAGDVLVPSGEEDGTAVAVSADELKVELAAVVVEGTSTSRSQVSSPNLRSP